MKRIIFIIFIAISTIALSNGINIPSSIENSFNSRYPHVENVCWEKSGEEYIADFYLDKHEARVHLNTEGLITEVDVVIAWNQVPQELRKFMYKNYHQFAIEECDVVEHKGHMDGYSIQFMRNGKHHQVYFDKKGLAHELE